MPQEQTNESFFANPQQESFPLFRTGKARSQANVQTDGAWHVVERVVSAAVAAGNADEAKSLLQTACKTIDQAAANHVFHKNTAARKKSALAQKVNAIAK